MGAQRAEENEMNSDIGVVIPNLSQELAVEPPKVKPQAHKTAHARDDESCNNDLHIQVKLLKEEVKSRP